MVLYGGKFHDMEVCLAGVWDIKYEIVCCSNGMAAGKINDDDTLKYARTGKRRWEQIFVILFFTFLVTSSSDFCIPSFSLAFSIFLGTMVTQLHTF